MHDDPVQRRVELAIVGAPKTATSSLLRYLSQHPELCGHPQLEMAYFVEDREYQRGWPASYERYYPDEPGPPVRLVAKRVDMMYRPQAVERLRAHNPQATVVVLLRDPVDRAYSAFFYARRRGWERAQDFADAVAGELRNGPVTEPDVTQPGSYLSTGVYAPYVRRLHARFGRTQVHTFLTADMDADAARVCTQVFAAVGVDTSFSPDTDVRHNTAATARSEHVARALAARTGMLAAVRAVMPDRVVDAGKRLAGRFNEQPTQLPPMPAQTRARLREFFRPYNDELATVLGRDLAVWNGD